MAYPRSHNPFADDDDDDEDFKPKNRGFGGFDDDEDDVDSGLSEAEKRQRYLQREVMRTADSAVASTQRSIGLIYESEKMGVETAEVCHTNRVLPQRSNIFPILYRVKDDLLFLAVLSASPVGADATGRGSEEGGQDVEHHGGGHEDQPEAHQWDQECVGRPGQLLQGQAGDKAAA